MLHEFVTTYRDEIIVKTRDKVRLRVWPVVSADELQDGVPLFLTQLSETLRWETTDTPFSPTAIAQSASAHGATLLGLGFTLSQVVHDYGDICQAITELAIAQGAPITVDEFNVLNRCLDTAIAEAVTEHARLTAASRTIEELDRARHLADRRASAELRRMGSVAHEVRDMLNTALFAFETLKRGTVAINGSTAAVLGRSLLNLRDFVNNTLADVSIGANHQRRTRIAANVLVGDIVAAAALQAEYRQLDFASTPVDPTLLLDVDPQLVSSAVTNLLNNAFKFTKAGGRVTLAVHRHGERLRIEVEDQCGGMPDADGDPFEPFVKRRGRDRSGVGLGLSIARKAVRAHDGDIYVRNAPGAGCTFVVDLPLTTSAAQPQNAPC